MKKIIFIFSVFITVSGSLFSQNAPSLAPLNPGFVSFMANLKSGKAPQSGNEGFGNGGMPPPGQVSFDNYLKNNKFKSTAFAPVYDMRTTGQFLTSVKGQTNNACWAFATMASVESRWLKLGLGTWDLSENNLKYCHGFVSSRNTYGNHWMSTAYFARRSGPLVETDDLNADGSACPTGKTPVGYITEARYLPNDMNTIKQAILDQGAIYTMMYFNPIPAYYNAANFTYYRGDSADVNHAVDLIGWDDTKVTAGGTGAWICKNSWGTGWGEAGYFYVSYNDQCILDYNAYWPVRIDYNPNTQVYGYDDLGNYNSINYVGHVGYMLVKFVASGNQLLSNVGTYAMAAGTSLEIDVFDNFDPQANVLSGLLSHQEGISCPMPGYYTTDLHAPVSIGQGNDFYIRIRYQTPNFEYPVPIEEAIADYSDPVIESNIAWTSANGANGSWFLIGNTTTDYKWDPCVKVYAEPAIAWTGTESTDWNTPGNWNPNTIPTASQNIRIPNVANNPVVNQDPGSPAVCNHLNIEQGAVLTIATGKALTVNGTLTNISDNTGLIVESGASLITRGNVNGTATVNRDISESRWHFISSPVSDAKAAIFTGKYLQKHSEFTNAYTNITSVAEALTTLKGYALWGDNSGFIAQYSGTLNTGNQSVNLTRTATGDNSGWNLVGNPYPSSIDWDAASGWTRDNVNGPVYIEKAGDWATYISGDPGVGTNEGSRFIASGQGFFVNVATIGTGILQITNDVRVHNSTAFFKTTSSNNLIRLNVSGNGYSDEAIVRFMPGATAEFDGRYDAYKLFGYNNESAQIYTLGSTPLTINSLPPETREVPLGIHANASGRYTIAATEIMYPNTVTLEDTRTGIFTRLSVNLYTFTFVTGENEQRFNLHFGALPGDDTGSSIAAVYSTNQTVYVRLMDLVKADIFICNTAGQLVATRTSAQGMNEISLAAAGIYIVKVITFENTMVRKVWVR